MRFSSLLFFIGAATPGVVQAVDSCPKVYRPSGNVYEKKAYSDAVFDGSQPFPVGERVLLHNAEDGRQMTVHIRSISDQNDAMKSMIAFLKRESLANPKMKFREFGAFYFDYKNKPGSSVGFTSNHVRSIDHETHMVALENEKILKSLATGSDDVHGVMHFHTHPGRELRDDQEIVSLLPNWNDYGSYQILASSLAFYAGRTIPFVGIVIPMCAHCEDVYFEVYVEPDPQIIAKMTMAKILRDALNAMESRK